MMPELMRLPVRIIPQEGEGVRGYLQRVAISNGLEQVQQLGKTNQLRLEDLAILLGRDDGKFWRSHPQSIYWAEENALKKVQWNWAHRRCCPTCLRKEGVWPIEWELRGMAVCQYHAVRLIDICPSCKKKLSWKTSQLTHCGCGFDLRKAEPEGCTDQETCLAKAIAASVGIGVCPNSLSNLKGMPTPHLFRLVYFLGKFGLGEGKVKVSDTASLDEIFPLFKEAAFTLSDWPHNYHIWITRLKGEEGAPAIGMGIPEVFGDAYTYMYKNLYEKPYNFVRQEFESYLLNNWSWPLNNRNKRIPLEVREDSSWIPTSKAAEELSVGKKLVQHLVYEGVLEAVMMTSRTGRIFIAVNRNDLYLARKHLAGIANLTQTAEVLGISEDRVLELYESEIINPISTAEDSTTGRWELKVSELRIITAYGGDAPVQLQISDDQVLLRGLLKSGLRGAGAFANLLRQIFTNRIEVVARLKDCRGISGWIIKRDDYESWAREILESKMPGYTVREVSKVLGVKEEVAYSLVRKGLIKADTQTLHGRKLSYISQDQLLAFEDEYVLGATLAKEHGTSPKKLMEILVGKGVCPVAGPRVDGCRQIVFERKSTNLVLSATTET